jgi:hypothetical protein
MAVNAEVQALPRRGMSPFSVGIAALVLAGAMVMGLLIGRWTAPSATPLQQARVAAPGWVADAHSSGYSGHLGFEAPAPITGSVDWVPAAIDAGFTGRLGFTTGFTGRLGFSTPDRGAPSGWENSAKDAGYTGRLGTSGR